MLAQPTHPPRAAATVLAGTDEAGLLAQVERCRLAAVPLAHPERQFSLQVFDLGRLRARLGLRWDSLRSRAVGQIRTGLARELGKEELAIDGGGDLLFAIRAAADRREVERHGELLAADVTARLCGTLPGGAIVRVTTLPFDPSTELIGATTAEIAAALARCMDPPAMADTATSGRRGAIALRPRFGPLLHLRKRLVSAYRLDMADGSDASELRPADIDAWALELAAGQLRSEPRRDPALVVPVHFATLTDMRSREAYARSCRALPSRSVRRLILEVLGLPPGLPQARAREFLALLRPFALALVVRLPQPQVDLAQLEDCGARGVSLSAAALDEDTIPALAAFVGRVRIAGMRSLLVDAATPATYRAALAAGIDHLGGEALLPGLPRPGRAFLVTRAS